MRIWISGCGGMMGSQLCGALVAAGHDVLASYYKPTVDSADLADLPLEEVDIRDWCSVYDSLRASARTRCFIWPRRATRRRRGSVRSRHWRPM